MNKQVILASNNEQKIKEYKNILNEFNIDVISQKEAKIEIEVEETGTTFAQNAIIKAKAIYEITKKPVIADDSGIEIDYLGGEPGVHSHRFLGEDTTNVEKCNKVLEMMQDAKEEERTARFKCAICYIDEKEKINIFEGICEGKISYEIRGDNEFCYDLIFMYGNKTFAEISEEEKDKVSHRRKAIDKFVEYLEK